ncbi:hypothetical protein M8818_002204 [Zalaria obscura]|uniref:Uncharacterized protein n=1 Tax=Zalaria obscura TaxID=2024903 RepID=A0ACC3SIR8_9PEZI
MSSNPAYGIPEAFRTTTIATPEHSERAAYNMDNTIQGRDQAQESQQIQGPQGSNHDTNLMSSSLPADDGMRALRQKMQEIQRLAVSTEEKAARMHMLMSEDYRTRNPGKLPPVTTPSPVASDARPTPQSTEAPSMPHSAHEYNLTPSDLEPSHCPEGTYTTDPDDSTSPPALGCAHYKRNVKIQCADCHLWVPCRFCHDSSPDLPFPHQLNRQATAHMLCMLCKTPQPAGETCINCQEDMAYYYCPKCKLWDDDSTKRIYHCEDCGICRRGEGLGKDYVHCRRCNVCISISTSESHPCIERATECDCPLCLEYLFSSPAPVVSLLCGHYMHASCYRDLMGVTYRCPVCSRSAVNMELQWRKLDDEIRAQPMPEEELVEVASTTAASITPPSNTTTPPTDTPDPAAAPHPAVEQQQPQQPQRRRLPKQVFVNCNDCGGRGWTAFHWLGLKCPVCDGYNTNQAAPIGGDTPNTRPLVGTSRQRQHDFTGIEVLQGLPRRRSDSATQHSVDGEGQGADVQGEGNGTEEGNGNEGDERADSAYLSHASASRPTTPTFPSSHSHGHYATHLTPSRLPLRPTPGRSYFLRAEAEGAENAAAASSHGPTAYGYGIPVPVLDTARFSPYDIIQRVQRSLSPMRMYLEEYGRRPSFSWSKDDSTAADAADADAADKELGEEKLRADGDARAGDAGAAAGAGKGVGDERVEFWGQDGHFLSGESADEDDGDDEEWEDESSEDEDEEEGDAEEEQDDMELLGHR